MSSEMLAVPEDLLARLMASARHTKVRVDPVTRPRTPVSGPVDPHVRWVCADDCPVCTMADLIINKTNPIEMSAA